MKTAYSITLLTERAETESVTIVSEKIVTQNTEKNGPGTVNVGLGTAENRLIWQMLNKGW